MTDYISRADAIEAVQNVKRTDNWQGAVIALLSALPSADAVSHYAEWLEQLIADAESFEWLCEETPIKEWCENTCRCSSIQAECLRQMYRFTNGERAEQTKFPATYNIDPKCGGCVHLDEFGRCLSFMTAKDDRSCWQGSWSDEPLTNPITEPPNDVIESADDVIKQHGRLIDADFLRARVIRSSSPNLPSRTKTTVQNMIDRAPTVEERPQGEWLEKYYDADDREPSHYVCSECRNVWNKAFIPFTWHFCPSCGASMVVRGDEK